MRKKTFIGGALAALTLGAGSLAFSGSFQSASAIGEMNLVSDEAFIMNPTSVDVLANDTFVGGGSIGASGRLEIENDTCGGCTSVTRNFSSGMEEILITPKKGVVGPFL
jgi:hypothetical protein